MTEQNVSPIGFDANEVVTPGSVVIRQVLPTPIAYSETNQTFVAPKDWREFLRRLGVPFVTPKKGHNVVLAKDLEAALKARASSLPKKMRVRPKSKKSGTPASLEASLGTCGIRVLR